MSFRPNQTDVVRDERMDRVGMALSVVCLVHCLALPPLLALLPLLGDVAIPGFTHDTEWFHAALLLPVLLISGPVLYRAAARQRSIGVLGLLGGAALFGALLAPSLFWEHAITILGACLLLGAHYLNLRLRLR